MSSDGDTEEVFDEEELAEGFDEEIVGEEDLEEVDDVEEVLDVEIPDVEDEVVIEVAIPDDDDVADDADVELALDEVLAETIRRSSTPEEDDEAPGEIDPLVDPAETILPKQDDEFRCASCRLLKKTTQLADRSKMLCRDCV
ncbi:MAG: DUF4193 family protein [Acidimicrobiales bacterium]|jgi:hypothetical protein